MTCRLTTKQLRDQALYHRQMAANFKGPTHVMKNEEEQRSFYVLTQTVMAEIYDELVTWREREASREWAG